MNFEEDLKNRLRVETLERIEREFQRVWENNNSLEVDLQDIRFDSIGNAYSLYMENRMRDSSEEQLFSILEDFEQAISAKVLAGMREEIRLQEQEKTYIKNQSQSVWRKYR